MNSYPVSCLLPGGFYEIFYKVFKINFVVKCKEIEIFKKHHINHFLSRYNIKREKYLKEGLFLNFFDILCNKPSRLRQKFAVGVTKLEDLTVIKKYKCDGNIQLESPFVTIQLNIFTGRPNY